MNNLSIPKCMSTQHPDNVNTPFFAQGAQLGGEDEIQEAYYAFSHLNIDEQMWDCEGKEVDNYVVKKLLTRYESFFRQQKLGQDYFLTLRIPNPTVEKAEAKVLLEALESIPRSFDAAKLFYGEDIAPIFEVILPMTATHKSIDRIYHYYKDFVVGKESKPFRDGDISIAEWIGEFKPKQINVIPLFEDMVHMLDADNITREYLKDKNVSHQRVFFARSDPAMNYGLISSVIINKIALQRMRKLSKDIGVKIHPILGLGSAPFRGNLTPLTVDRILREYSDVRTFTIQSAFKYDYSVDQVKKAVDRLHAHIPHPLDNIDEQKCLAILDKYCREYQRQIVQLAPSINRIAKFIPSRRKRKLHVGLFGYARSMQGVTLPRAITFTSALYSLGLPPEILGLNAISKQDWDYLKTVYLNLEQDLGDALQYFNPDNTLIPDELKGSVNQLMGQIDVAIHKEHKKLSDAIHEELRDHSDQTRDLVLKAASIRKFLG